MTAYVNRAGRRNNGSSGCFTEEKVQNGQPGSELLSTVAVLRVAVNAPLSRLFDYLARDDTEVVPGMRVSVPFGRRKVTGLVVEIANSSALPRGKLKKISAVLDDTPLLPDSILELIRFTSDYYHHPIGEVAFAALPAPLRQGKPLKIATEVLRVTADGRAFDPSALETRAPRQAELLRCVQAAARISADELDDAVPGWRRVKNGLIGKGLVEADETVVDALPSQDRIPAGESGPELNPDQAAALEAIRGGSGFRVCLLDGVTGSGKTEVYLRLIADTLLAGKQVLVLVPEIGLTPQLVRRMQKRLGYEPVPYHSGLTDSERHAAWRAARDGSARLIVGTRSAVFLPLASPGLLIVDEEHDPSLKQQEGLRYSARDLAIARGKRLQAPVVLGTATPSCESLQRCRDGAYQHLRLPQRAGRAIPPLLRLVDLTRVDSAEGLSPQALAAIRSTIANDGQVLVFLNRRGFAPTLICGACGEVSECPRCDSRMTVHAGIAKLLCHHCGAQRDIVSSCENCGGACRPLGQGTERLEDVLRAAFPQQVITRVDSDTTRLKGTMSKALAMATAGETRILVGTQMLSKGHHFPNLTLVVVVNADQGLFSTDFRGSERLAQSLIQVAGRAGRKERQGEVLIQTAFPSHPFWSALLSGGYERVIGA